MERIRDALDEGRLVVYSQQIIDLQTGDVVREELLVRMVDPHGDKIPPASFLPAAERFGLIHEIDLMVLTKAIELARGGTSVAINVSVRLARALPTSHRAWHLLPKVLPKTRFMALSRTRLAFQGHTANSVSSLTERSFSRSKQRWSSLHGRKRRVA